MKLNKRTGAILGFLLAVTGGATAATGWLTNYTWTFDTLKKEPIPAVLVTDDDDGTWTTVKTGTGLTVNGTITASTTGLATSAKQDTGNTSVGNIDTAVGAKADSSAASDTGTYSLIALTKRIATHLASLTSGVKGTRADGAAPDNPIAMGGAKNTDGTLHTLGVIDVGGGVYAQLGYVINQPQFQGMAADNATASGNPVLVAGVGLDDGKAHTFPMMSVGPAELPFFALMADSLGGPPSGNFSAIQVAGVDGSGNLRSLGADSNSNMPVKNGACAAFNQSMSQVPNTRRSFLIDLGASFEEVTCTNGSASNIVGIRMADGDSSTDILPPNASKTYRPSGGLSGCIVDTQTTPYTGATYVSAYGCTHGT